MPRFLLGVRLKDILRGKCIVEPLEAGVELETYAELQAWRWRWRVSRVRALHEINQHGLVAFNLVKATATGIEAAADENGGRFLSHMAPMGHGPLHIGRRVALEKYCSAAILLT